MKQITSLALIMLVTFSSVFAKDRTSKHTTVKNDVITVTYGKPSKSDGSIVPSGTAWRTGLDEPTIVTLSKGCMFGGRQVTAGTYSLITVPYKGEWALMLSTDLSVPATFDYESIKDKTVLNTSAVITPLKKSAGAFSIDLDADGLVITWDNSSVSVPVHPW